MDQKISLSGVLGIVGIVIGFGIGKVINIYPYITIPLLCFILGAAFTGIGMYLNNKGLLYNLYQLVDIILGLFVFYFMFFVICGMILLNMEIDEGLKNSLLGIIPIPFAVIMMIRHINKKRSFKRKIEVDGELIEVETEPKVRKSREKFKLNVKWGKVFLWTLGLIGVALFLIYIYPGLYIYDKFDQKYPVKINRFTGDTYILGTKGWVKVDQE